MASFWWQPLTAAPSAVTLTPSPVVATFIVAAPTVVTGAVTLTPAPVVAKFQVAAPTVNNGLTLHPSPVVARFLVATSTVVKGVRTLTPSPVVARFLIATPTVTSSSGAQTLHPVPVVARFLIAAPTVIGGGVPRVPTAAVPFWPAREPSPQFAWARRVFGRVMAAVRHWLAQVKAGKRPPPLVLDLGEQPPVAKAETAEPVTLPEVEAPPAESLAPAPFDVAATEPFPVELDAARPTEEIAWPEPPEPWSPSVEDLQRAADRAAVEAFLAELTTTKAVGPVLLAGRHQLRAELAQREASLVRAVRAALADVQQVIGAAELRGAWALGSLPHHLAQELERTWDRHVEPLVLALAQPVRITRQDDEPAGPFPETTPFDLAQRQVGELIRALGPRQLEAVREQLAALMNLGPTAEVLQGIAQATGLTPKQTEQVGRFLERQRAAGASRAVAARTASQYADRLLARRAETIARQEAVRYTNALVLERGAAVAQGGGMISKQSVSARDGNVDAGDPEGVCQVLDDGRRIPLAQPFVFRGQSFAGPPYHIGCRCLVEIWREA